MQNVHQLKSTIEQPFEYITSGLKSNRERESEASRAEQLCKVHGMIETLSQKGAVACADFGEGSIPLTWGQLQDGNLLAAFPVPESASAILRCGCQDAVAMCWAEVHISQRISHASLVPAPADGVLHPMHCAYGMI